MWEDQSYQNMFDVAPEGKANSSHADTKRGQAMPLISMMNSSKMTRRWRTEGDGDGVSLSSDRGVLALYR